MNLFRLARLFETKYGLKSEAASPKDTFDSVKRELRDAYNNYINPKTFVKAYNILIILDSLGEIHSRQITNLMKDLNEKIFDSTPQDMLTKVNGILAIIDSLQDKNHVTIRNSIRKHWAEVQRRVPSDNELKMALSKWEQVVNKKLASILHKQAEKLKVLAKSNEAIMGGPVKPIPMEPTAEEQFRFRFTPLAVHHRLDDPEIFNKVWDNPELKPRVIDLINKSENVKTKVFTDPEIMREVLTILRSRQRQQTNEGLFNAPEEVAQQRMNVLPPEEDWSRQMQEAKRLKQEEPDQEDPIIRDEMHKRRLEQDRLKQIEEDRERLMGSKSGSRMEQILKRYQ